MVNREIASSYSGEWVGWFGCLLCRQVPTGYVRLPGGRLFVNICLRVVVVIGGGGVERVW